MLSGGKSSEPLLLLRRVVAVLWVYLCVYIYIYICEHMYLCDTQEKKRTGLATMSEAQGRER